jgi:hypothetical protein
MTTTDDTTTTTRRRTRRSASTAGAARTRRQRASGDELLAQLTAQVDRLIAENRDLKRALARAEKAHGASGVQGQASRTLAGLQRRVSQALASDGRGRGRGRGAEPAAAPRPRRKVTDPEVLERRRAALAKARAARAAKRAAGAG